MPPVKIAGAGRNYVYTNVQPSHSQRYLRHKLERAINSRAWPDGAPALDYGSGSGWWAGQLARMGFRTTGADISESGVALACEAFPEVEFTTDASHDGLRARGPFALVTCIEVIAHCYKPGEDLKTMFDCLEPGGRLVLSTPYHGYFKNLALALTGGLERYLDTSWPGSYVNYYSIRSISDLLTKIGFRELEIWTAGRIPPVARSIVVGCNKPY